MNEELTVPFTIGKTYWYPITNPTRVQKVCEVCYGHLTVTVTLGNGEHVAIECGNCGVSYEPPTGYTWEYAYQVGAEPFTIQGINSMYNNEWYVQSTTGKTAYFKDLVEDEALALHISQERIAKEEEENMRRSCAIRSSMVKKFPWSIGYHEKLIKEFERKIEWNRSKVSERRRIA